MLHLALWLQWSMGSRDSLLHFLQHLYHPICSSILVGTVKSTSLCSRCVCICAINRPSSLSVKMGWALLCAKHDRIGQCRGNDDVAGLCGVVSMSRGWSVINSFLVRLSEFSGPHTFCSAWYINVVC